MNRYGRTGRVPYGRWPALAAALLAGLGAARAADEPTQATGVTSPLHDVSLSSPVTGTIATNCYKEGDRVRAGDVILELKKDMELFEAQRRKLIWESKAELDAAEARVLTMKTAVESMRRLFNSTRSVSQEDLDKSELEYKMAVAERDRLRDAEAREKIEYSMALEQLRQRRIVAPFDGILTDLYLEVGEDCEPRQPVARLVNAAECFFTANVESPQASRLSAGAQVLLQIDGAAGAIARTGVVEFVSAVVDPASGLQKVKVRFDNADGRVSAGVAGALSIPAALP